MLAVGVYTCTNPECHSTSFTGWYEVSEKRLLDEFGDCTDTIDSETHDGPDDIYCYYCKAEATYKWIELEQYKNKYGVEPSKWYIQDMPIEDIDQSMPFIPSQEELVLPINSPFEVMI